MGFRKADDFYIALGQAKVSARVVVNKVLQRLKQGEAAVEERPGEGLVRGKDERAHPEGTASRYGIHVEGIDDVMVRLAKCCRPVPGDEIVGYISLGRGITIHRRDCRNVVSLMKVPERFTEVSWEGGNDTAFRVELQVDAWDRTRLLEDVSRTFAEAGINILEARCTVDHPMVKNRFVVEVADTVTLKNCVTRLRNVDSVFDRIPRRAGRLTPGTFWRIASVQPLGASGLVRPVGGPARAAPPGAAPARARRVDLTRLGVDHVAVTHVAGAGPGRAQAAGGGAPPRPAPAGAAPPGATPA